MAMDTMTSILIYVIVVIVVISLLASARMIVIIGGRQVGIVERKLFGARLPSDRVVALHGQIGIQARILGPGLHLFFPFLFIVRVDNLVAIGEDQVGIAESIDGRPLDPGEIFGRFVTGHTHFQDAEAFLKNGGQKGIQTEALPPGLYRVNSYLFKITVMDAITIPAGSIGIVNAAAGQPLDPGRLYARSVPGHNNFQDGEAFLEQGGQKGPQLDILRPGRYRINLRMFDVKIYPAIDVPSGKVGIVTANDGEELPENELIAKTIQGHDMFQNAAAFLMNGGQRGPQLDVLTPGKFYINPLMFSVQTSDALTVNQGQVAVIISNVGKQPAIAMSSGEPKANADAADDFNAEKYVVTEGYRGIQRSVLGPGNFYLNLLAFRPIIINTTNTTIDWDDAADTKFDSLNVNSKDGFALKVGVKVVIRVLPDQSPYLVSRIGSIENLITNVIHPLIDSSFRNQASTASAMQFLQDRHEQQDQALKRAVNELSKYHVEVLSVLISNIVLPPELMETQTNKVLALQRQSMFDEQRNSEQKRIAMEKTRAEADKQATLVAAQIDVQVAEQIKQKTIAIAQGEAERIRLEGQGEADKILSIGKNTAQAYELTKQAVTAEGLVSIELMKLISEKQIKITPEILITGGDGAGALVNAVLAKLMKGNLQLPGQQPQVPDTSK
jgi:regulator of protease activity HflC (stomatin/prohibitin superfamily)